MHETYNVRITQTSYADSTVHVYKQCDSDLIPFLVSSFFFIPRRRRRRRPVRDIFVLSI
jgi:hypothetical protein